MKLKAIVNPNPFTSEFAVLIHGNFPVNVVIRLINNRGTVIKIAATTLKKGENNVKINNLLRYANGQYKLEIKLLNGDLLETVSLVKT